MDLGTLSVGSVISVISVVKPSAGHPKRLLFGRKQNLRALRVLRSSLCIWRRGYDIDHSIGSTFFCWNLST